MIEVLKVNPIYSNQQVLEVDKVGVTLKNKDKKGQDATVSLIFREKDGQNLLTQDFELFIGANKENEFIIPLEVPIGGDFPCEIRIVVQIGGKVATESKWYDLIEGAEGDGGAGGETKPYETEFDVEEDTQTEVMAPAGAEEDHDPVDVAKTGNEPTVILEDSPDGDDQEGVTSSWGVLIEDGQEDLYEATVESDLPPEPPEEPKEEEDTIASSFEDEMAHMENTPAPQPIPQEETAEIEPPPSAIEDGLSTADQELTPTITEEYEKGVLEDDDLEEELEEEIEEESDESDQVKKKRSPLAAILIIFIVIVAAAASYYFFIYKKAVAGDDKVPKKEKEIEKGKETDEEDIDLDDLFSTDKDDILGDMTKKEFVVETAVLNDDQLGVLEPLMEKHGGNILETPAGYKMTFNFEDKKPAAQLKEELIAKGVKSTISEK